jgi:hypothetical protein
MNEVMMHEPWDEICEPGQEAREPTEVGANILRRKDWSTRKVLSLEFRVFLVEQSPSWPSSILLSSHFFYIYSQLTCIWSVYLSFSKKTQNSSSSLFFSSVVCIHLGFLWTDISGTDLALLFHLTFMSYHSSSFHSCQFFMFFES